MNTQSDFNLQSIISQLLSGGAESRLASAERDSGRGTGVEFEEVLKNHIAATDASATFAASMQSGKGGNVHDLVFEATKQTSELADQAFSSGSKADSESASTLQLRMAHLMNGRPVLTSQFDSNDEESLADLETGLTNHLAVHLEDTPLAAGMSPKSTDLLAELIPSDTKLSLHSSTGNGLEAENSGLIPVGDTVAKHGVNQLPGYTPEGSTSQPALAGNGPVMVQMSSSQPAEPELMLNGTGKKQGFGLPGEQLGTTLESDSLSGTVQQQTTVASAASGVRSMQRVNRNPEGIELAVPASNTDATGQDGNSELLGLARVEREEAVGERGKMEQHLERLGQVNAGLQTKSSGPSTGSPAVVGAAPAAEFLNAGSDRPDLTNIAFSSQESAAVDNQTSSRGQPLPVAREFTYRFTGANSFGSEIPEFMAEIVRERNDSSDQRIRLRLFPENLGRIDATISEGSDGLRIQFMAESDQIARLLRDSNSVLRDLLADGETAVHVEVGVSGQEADSGSGGNGQESGSPASDQDSTVAVDQAGRDLLSSGRGLDTYV